MTRTHSTPPSRPRTTATIPLVALALAVILAPPRTAVGQSADPCPAVINVGPDIVRLSIVGTWDVRIIPSEGPSFSGFYSFFEDGNVLFSSAGPPLPALGNPGHGVWRRVSANAFDVTFKQLTFDETLQTNGSLKVVARVCLSGLGSFVTRDDVTIYDPEGNEVLKLGGSARGTRMVAERPPL